MPQPEGDTAASQQAQPHRLLDDLVGAQLKFTAYRQPKRLRSLEIDDQLEFTWLLTRTLFAGLRNTASFRSRSLVAKMNLFP